MLAHVVRERMEDDKSTDERIKVLCSFINPEAAKNLFSEGEKVENTGFLDDMKAMDPNFNYDDYQEIMES